MDFVIHRHGEIALAFGLAALAVWWLARRRAAGPVVRRSLNVFVRAARASRGVVGLDQYKTHLPTQLVWIHVGAGLRPPGYRSFGRPSRPVAWRRAAPGMRPSGPLRRR